MIPEFVHNVEERVVDAKNGIMEEIEKYLGVDNRNKS